MTTGPLNSLKITNFRRNSCRNLALEKKYEKYQNIVELKISMIQKTSVRYNEQLKIHGKPANVLKQFHLAHAEFVRKKRQKSHENRHLHEGANTYYAPFVHSLLANKNNQIK